MEETGGTLVVVGVDESEESMRALSWACRFLSQAHTDDGKATPYKLILLHVQPDTCFAAGPAYILSNEAIDLLEIDARRTTKRIFKRALGVCEENKVKAETQVAVGEAKERLCQVVQKLGADLLVTGTRGYGFLRRLILGSVSDYCSRNAVCPVVVVNQKVGRA